MKTKTAIAVSLGLMLAAVSIALATVKVDYSHHANFERYHTYSWGKVQTQNPLWQDRITRAVDQAMQSRGLQEVPSGGDLTVMAVGIAKEHETLNTFYDNMGGGWFWGGFGESTTTPEYYRQGTLVVDLFDTNTKHLVWRGVSTATLSEKPEKNEKKMDKDVSDMFGHYPTHGGRQSASQ